MYDLTKSGINSLIDSIIETAREDASFGMATTVRGLARELKAALSEKLETADCVDLNLQIDAKDKQIRELKVLLHSYSTSTSSPFRSECQKCRELKYQIASKESTISLQKHDIVRLKEESARKTREIANLEIKSAAVERKLEELNLTLNESSNPLAPAVLLGGLGTAESLTRKQKRAIVFAFPELATA